MQIGDRVDDRFEIRSIVRRGVASHVYRARDLATGSDAALKIFAKSNPVDVGRFEREAQLLAELSHAAIVRYIGHGVERNGGSYLAMEWLEGEDLASRLLRGPLSVTDSLLLVARLASALAAAHSLGIVHRDVKPSNIFLTAGSHDRPAPKLVDFGVAKVAGGSSILTRAGNLVGTPAYMAPEQVRGLDPEPSVDIFALGCVLYECLTGHQAFIGSDVRVVLARIAFAEPIPITSVRADVPHVVIELVSAMLQKDPTDRPPTASALAVRLRTVAEAASELGTAIELPPDSLATSRHPSSLHGHRFELRRQLGAGAFGRVFEAFDRQTNAVVALKILTQPDADSLYRFKREFRAVTSLFHSNVVTLHELFVDGEQSFFTMERVIGVDIISWVRNPGREEALGDASEGDPSVNEARLRAALSQLVAGVQALHSAGVIHRDLKPSNVLVTTEGRVVILDFGLAVDVKDGASATLGAGTPAYMAPEQAWGGEVGPAADWYAVGGLLYEALTGRPPFEGPSHRILQLKQNQSPPPLPEQARGVSPELCQLALDLLAADPAQRPGEAAIVAAFGHAAANEPTAAIFVGRDQERALLAEALAASLGGVASVALVHGPSGIGKSALLSDFVRQNCSNATVLRGRCNERERVPFNALDGLVESLARHLAGLPQVEAASFAPRDADVVVKMFPSLMRVDALARACRGKPLPGDAIEMRRRGARALREMLQRLADQKPTVLVIDDAQRSDSDSAALLAEIFLPPDEPALLLILAYRDDHDASQALPLHAALPREAIRLTDVPVGPLDASSIGLLVRRLGRRDADVGHFIRESQGNPFFIAQLLEAHPRKSSTSLHELLLERVATLSPAAHRLLEIIAVAGKPIPQRIALRVADLSGNSGLDAMTELRRASLVLVRQGDQVEPHHDMIREALAASLGGEELARCHAAIVDALGSDASPELLAYHLHAAGSADLARHHYEKAGDAAMEALAFSRAAEHYALADTGEGVDVLLKLAKALVGAGRGRQAAETLLRGSALCGGDKAHDLRRRAAEEYFRSGLFEEGVSAINPLMVEAGLTIPQSRWWTVILIYWHAMRLLLTWRMTGTVNARAKRRATLCRSMWYIGAYEPHRGGLFMIMGARFARKSGDPFLHASHVKAAACFLGNEKLALDVMATTPLSASQRGALDGWVRFTRALGLMSRGELVRAKAAMLEAESSFEGELFAYERGVARVWLMETLWQVGDLAEFKRRAHEHLLECHNRDDKFGIEWSQIVFRRRVLLLEDRLEEARELTERFARPGKSPDDIIPYLARLSACEVAAYARDPIAAASARNELEKTAKDSLLIMPSPFNVMRTFTIGCLGLAAVVEGNVARARRCARTLEKARSFGGDVVYASLVRAGVSTGTAAIVAYQRAAGALAQYPMHATAARLRLAQLRGDNDAQELELAALRARGAKNPEAFSSLLAPRRQT